MLEMVNVAIWSDKWVPSLYLIHPPQDSTGTKGREDEVPLLIDEDSHGWDVGMVNHYF